MIAALKCSKKIYFNYDFLNIMEINLKINQRLIKTLGQIIDFSRYQIVEDVFLCLAINKIVKGSSLAQYNYLATLNIYLETYIF